ncbi:MAG TPA: fructose-bisphosphatase class II family protein [Candidatus Dormibacteraeota bacterium]
MTTVSRPVAARPRQASGHNHGLELLRATEAAALSVGRWLGRGDKTGTREAAISAMADALAQLPFDGRIVIGNEDAQDPLGAGHRVGAGREKRDLALVPVDGISLVSRGLTQALSTCAVAEPGGILAPPPVAYMHKIAVGPTARGSVDITDTPENNLRRVAFAMDVHVRDLTVAMLDRPRHQALLERVRDMGARVALISDGDVGAAIMAAVQGTGVDVMLGAGGTREAVLAACALRCLGGELQCRPWVRHEGEAAAVRAAGFDPDEPLSMERLVPGSDVAVAVTGVSGGSLLRGVLYHGWWAETHSLVMRARSGTIREISTKHHVALRPEEGSTVR